MTPQRLVQSYFPLAYCHHLYGFFAIIAKPNALDPIYLGIGDTPYSAWLCAA